MNFKSIKGFAAEAATVLSRAVQYGEEKLGRSEKTELDSDFEDLANKADRVQHWTQRIINKSEAVLQPNPGTRVEDFIYEKLEKRKERLQNLEQLGDDMIDSGIEFGSSSPYGSTLIKVGQTQQKLGLAEREFISASYKGFVGPLKKFLDEDMRNVNRERKILESKRLDLDVAKNRIRKAKSAEVQANAEFDCKKAQEDFDQQIEITRILLEGISSAQQNHIRCLNEFVEAQIEFFAKCHDHMTELKSQLCLNEPGRKLGHSLSLSSPINDATSPPPLPALPPGKIRACVLFDYDAKDPSELSLEANEVIVVSQPPPNTDPTWMICERGAKTGKVPLAYLEFVNP